MYASDIFKADGFVELAYDDVLQILKGDGISASETEVMNAAIAWAKAECKRTKTEDSNDNVKKAMKDLLYAIRFPLMALQELAMIKLLDQSQLLALFTYAGQKSSDPKSAHLDDSLKAFSAKARKPRAPIGPVVSGQT